MNNGVWYVSKATMRKLTFDTENHLSRHSYKWKRKFLSVFHTKNNNSQKEIYTFLLFIMIYVKTMDLYLDGKSLRKMTIHVSCNILKVLAMTE